MPENAEYNVYILLNNLPFTGRVFLYKEPYYMKMAQIYSKRS